MGVRARGQGDPYSSVTETTSKQIYVISRAEKRLNGTLLSNLVGEQSNGSMLTRDILE